MCLCVLNIPEDLNPKIATEDILCYKLLLYNQTTNRYETPYQNFPIVFGYKNRYDMAADEMTGFYYAEQMFCVKSSWTVNSFLQPSFVSEELKWINGKNIQQLSRVENPTSEFLDIHAGIHAYLNIDNIFIGHDCIHFFKAIIPKGAHYFIGREDDIVADKMIIFDEHVK